MDPRPAWPPGWLLLIPASPLQTTRAPGRPTSSSPRSFSPSTRSALAPDRRQRAASAPLRPRSELALWLLGLGRCLRVEASDLAQPLRRYLFLQTLEERNGKAVRDLVAGCDALVQTARVERSRDLIRQLGAGRVGDVLFGRAQVLVAHERLDRPNVDALGGEARAERVPKVV